MVDTKCFEKDVEHTNPHIVFIDVKDKAKVVKNTMAGAIWVLVFFAKDLL